jgi:hypothetical protein
VTRKQSNWQVHVDLPERYFVQLFEEAPTRLVRCSPDGIWSSWDVIEGRWIEAANQGVGASVVKSADDPDDPTWWAIRPGRVEETIAFLVEQLGEADIRHAQVLRGQGQTLDEISAEMRRSKDWLREYAGLS